LTDNKPAYTVRVAEAGEYTRNFAAFFEDGSGIRREIEVDETVPEKCYRSSIFIRIKVCGENAMSY